MSKHAWWCVFPAVVWIPLFIPSGIIAQTSASNRETAMTPSQQLQSGRSAHAVDPSLEEISKAEQEGRLLDAEKLLNTAIAEAETEVPSGSGLGSLLNNLANVEYRLHHYKQAIAEEKRAVTADHVLGAQATARVFLDLDELGAYARFSGDYTTFAQATPVREKPGPLSIPGVEKLSGCSVLILSTAIDSSPDPRTLPAGCLTNGGKKGLQRGKPGNRTARVGQIVGRWGGFPGGMLDTV